MDEIPESRHLLSAWLRERFERTGGRFEIDDRGPSREFPHDFAEMSVAAKLRRTLEVVAGKSASYGMPSAVDRTADWPLVQAHDADEFRGMLNHLRDSKLLEQSGSDWLVTGAGWEAVEEVLQARRSVHSAERQAFVAMAFGKDDDLEAVSYTHLTLPTIYSV